MLPTLAAVETMAYSAGLNVGAARNAALIDFMVGGFFSAVSRSSGGIFFARWSLAPR